MKTKKKVCVLLSTYNGEKYIKELVDSVLSQNEVEVELFVRDDGSSDRTIEILNEYQDPRIIITTGENLKPAQSFLCALRNCPNADYYAYCDQDDVWYPNKLITAINKIEIESSNKPSLYMSTYDVVDSQLRKIMTYDMHYERALELGETIIYRSPSGCTMVFNDKFKSIIDQKKPQYVRMHDFWTLMVAEALHCEIITDSVPLIMYRQHDNSTVGITPSFSTRAKRLVKSAFSGDHERWRQAKCLYDSYKDILPDDSKDLLETVVNYRNSFKNRIKLMNDARFTAGDLYANVLFKLSVIIGVF